MRRFVGLILFLVAGTVVGEASECPDNRWSRQGIWLDMFKALTGSAALFGAELISNGLHRSPSEASVSAGVKSARQPCAIVYDIDKQIRIVAPT